MSKGTIVVTGAAGALGAHVAKRLLAAGWDVAAVDISDADRLPEHAIKVGGVDLTDHPSVVSVFAGLGPLRGLVNIAGGFAWEKVEDGDVATWDRLYALNVKTALNASFAALPSLSAGGAIVNVGAVAAQKAEIGMAPYAASKSGVARLTESLAAELKPRRIRVNAILPSIIDTPANRAELPNAKFETWVTTDELANVIIFLLSPEASGVTGAAIAVTGRA
ncbi:MAG: SDR family NAD(P)-dependent oxidoreductase [Flavobacteriaceae bacterium]